MVIILFNFFRHYTSPPFHTVIRVHLISLSNHILVILPSHFSSMEQMLMLMLMLRHSIVISDKHESVSRWPVDISWSRADN